MSNRSDNSFAYLMQDVTRHLRTQFDRRAAHVGLTRAQWRALKAISRRQGLSQTELAEQLDMEPIPVGRVVDRLEKSGYAERRADPIDRRRWCLYLTDKAQPVIDELELVAEGLRGDVLRGIRRGDLDTLLQVLGQIKQNLVALDAPAATQENTR